MTDLRIRITESDGIRYAGKIEGDFASTLYVGGHVAPAISAAIEALDALRGSTELVDALFAAPDLCELATAIRGLHMAESDDISDDEARAILEGLYNSQQPEAVRVKAGEMLRALAGRMARA